MNRRSSGFTLVELLVVLGIAGLLIAIGLPVLQNARETARRNQCSQNLRQLGLALLQYHDSHKCFPAGQSNVQFGADTLGRFAEPQEAKQQVSGAKPPRPVPQGQSWIVAILPELNQAELAQRWNFTTNVRGNGDGNGPAVTEIPGLYCPSRRSTMQATGQFSHCERVDSGWTSGGNDYAACSGSGISFKDDDPEKRQTYWLTPNQFSLTLNVSAAGSPYSQAPLHQGAFGVNSRTTLGEIQDGLSSTVLLSERRVFSNASAGSKAPLANAATENQRRSSDGWAFGGPATLFTTRLPPQLPGPQFGRHFDEAGSEHQLGFNVFRADGSIRFVSYNIDLRTWNNLGNINNGAASQF